MSEPFTNLSNEKVAPQKKVLVDWLATPESEREVKTLSDLADQLGVTRQTLYNWKVQPPVIEEVVRRKRELAGVVLLPKVVDALAGRANRTQGEGVKEANEAAKIFLQWFYGQGVGDKGVNVNVGVSQSTGEGQPRQEVLSRIDRIVAGKEPAGKGSSGGNGQIRD